MLRVAAQIRPGIIDQRVEHTQTGLFVSCAIAAAPADDVREAQQPLGGNRRCRAIDRFLIIERIGGRAAPISEAARPGAPVSQYGTPSAAAAWSI